MSPHRKGPEEADQSGRTLEDLPRKFQEHMRHPHNQGTLANPGGSAEMTGQCGDSIAVDIRLDGDSIRDIRARPTGCVYTLVCSSAMSRLAKGRTINEALWLEPEDVAREVGGLPEDHMHCARLALNALGEAIADHLERAGKISNRKNQKQRRLDQEGHA